MKTEWIAVDWGTSNLRCWALGADGRVLDQSESASGMSSVIEGGGDFEAALLEQIQPWQDGSHYPPVIACGMVGARQGWIEAPYETAPCSPITSLTRVPCSTNNLDVSILGGVRQQDPPDVMRGEETQVSGLLSSQPDFEGVVCLPGTHSKWVRVSRGRIDSFRTFLTGEMFQLMSRHSVLRLTISGEGWREPAFLEGVNLGRRQPGGFLSHLFGLRAESLIAGLDGETARSRLSGLLIGQEIAGALNTIPEAGPVHLIGDPSITSRYRSAMESVGLAARCCDGTEMTLRGLKAGRENYRNPNLFP